jgi:hypothetical protein
MDSKTAMFTHPRWKRQGVRCWEEERSLDVPPQSIRDRFTAFLSTQGITIGARWCNFCPKFEMKQAYTKLTTWELHLIPSMKLPATAEPVLTIMIRYHLNTQELERVC